MDQETGDRIAKAIHRLAALRATSSGFIVTLPVQYPSGALTTVEVVENGGTCFLSDLGQGRFEAEMQGADSFFDKIARNVSEDFGVSFDGASVFTLKLSLDRLEAGLTCVANASAQAAQLAVTKCDETKANTKDDRIFDRVISIFGPKNVARNRTMSGLHANWEAANVVQLDEHFAVFEHMTSHANSISSKFLKFTDIKGSSPSISLNAMVEDIQKLDVKAQIIGDVANLINLNANDEDIIRFASVA